MSDSQLVQPDSQGQYQSKLPTILACGKFFKVVNVANGNVRAQCLSCSKTISGLASASSNFLQHLKSKHPGKVSDYAATEKLKRGRKRISKEDDTNQPSISSQHSLPFKIEKKDVPIDPANRFIVNYIVQGIRPLTTVREKSFKELVNALQEKPLESPIMSYEEVVTEIRDRIDALRTQIRKEISKHKFFSITTDAWSGGRRNFLGVTLHWIAISEEGVVERKSAVIALSRFAASHSYDRVRELLLHVMKMYELTKENVVGMVMDGGLNFCKAFRIFGSEWKRFDLNLVGGENQDGEDSSESVVPVELEGLQQELNDDGYLPLHFRCTAHHLSNIATSLAVILEDTRGLWGSLKHALDNVSNYWDLSSIKAEVIVEVCGVSFITPNNTHWISWFDAIRRVLCVQDRLPELQRRITGLPAITGPQIEALQEYIDLLEPLAIALDRLQADNVFMGEFLPTVRRIHQLASESNFPRLKPLKEALLSSLSERFRAELELDVAARNSIIASVSHPAHKLLWVPEAKMEFTKTLMLEAMKAESQSQRVVEAGSSQQRSEASKRSKESEERREFLGYTGRVPANVPAYDTNLQVELHNFLADDVDELVMLENYKTVRLVFLRYNTMMPSQAPSERLFSYGGLLLSPKRRSLTDQNVESLALLKCNKDNFINLGSPNK